MGIRCDVDRREGARLGPKAAPRAGWSVRAPRGIFRSMFDELGRIFRKSVSAFRSELGRHEPEDQVAELLSAMRREWVSARAELPVIQENRERARKELARERELLEQTERRGRLAEGIGDGETTRIAAEYAARHREKATVLEQKVAAADAEWELRNREVEEMKRKYQEADSNRFVLLNELKRAGNQSRMRSVAEEAHGSFSDFDRMQEKIDSTRSYADALEELDADLGGPPPPSANPPPAADVDERLRELKRRMGKD